MRETVRDGEPALAVDTEEEFYRALGSGVYVVPPSWADAMAWHPWDEENTDFLEDVLATDDDPGPDAGRCVSPPPDGLFGVCGPSGVSRDHETVEGRQGRGHLTKRK